MKAQESETEKGKKKKDELMNRLSLWAGGVQFCRGCSEKFCRMHLRVAPPKGTWRVVIP